MMVSSSLSAKARLFLMRSLEEGAENWHPEMGRSALDDILLMKKRIWFIYTNKDMIYASVLLRISKVI